MVKASRVDHFCGCAFINVSSILDWDVLYVHLSATMAPLTNSIASSNISRELASTIKTVAEKKHVTIEQLACGPSHTINYVSTQSVQPTSTTSNTRYLWISSDEIHHLLESVRQNFPAFIAKKNIFWAKKWHRLWKYRDRTIFQEMRNSRTRNCIIRNSNE